MPHEFPFYGHDSCNASLTGPDNSSRSRSSLIHVPSTTTATKPLVMASTTAAAKGYSASPPTSAPGATTAPRKPSQLGLFCTDKENGRRSGNGFGVVSGAGQSVAAASATTRQVPNPPPGPTAPASLAAYGHGHTPNPKVPKHIYDSAMKTFYSVVKFLGKVRRACEREWKWEAEDVLAPKLYFYCSCTFHILLLPLLIREVLLAATRLSLMRRGNIMQPRLSRRSPFKNQNKRTRYHQP